MSWVDVAIPAVTGIASVFTTGGAFVAYLNRKTKQDRELDQQHKTTEIDQLKIDVTKDVVILLREELGRKAAQALEDDAKIQQYERTMGWMRRRIVRLENWAETALRENPNLPNLPASEPEPT